MVHVPVCRQDYKQNRRSELICLLTFYNQIIFINKNIPSLGLHTTICLRVHQVHNSLITHCKVDIPLCVSYKKYPIYANNK